MTVRKYLITPLLALLASLTLATPAHADSSTGGGGGYNSGTSSGGYSNFFWRQVTSDDNASAYDKFQGTIEGKVGITGYTPAQVRGFIRTKVINYGDRPLLDVCSESQAIWYLANGGANRNWTPDFQGTSIPTTGTGSFAGAEAVLGAGVSAEMLGTAQEWINGTGSKNMVLVCSGQWSPPAPPSRNWDTSSDQTSYSPTELLVTKPYSYTTEVKPRTPVGGPPGVVDPIGKQNLHPQTSQAQKTNFGVLVDAVNRGDYRNQPNAAIQAAIDRALAADARMDHAKVDLDAANREGMAEGGVLDVYEHVLPASIWAKETHTTITTTSCSYSSIPVLDKASNSYFYPPATEKCSTSSKPGPTYYESNASLKTQYNSAFWQMISTHCNASGFNALTAATAGVDVRNTGDTTRNLAAVAYSRVYRSNGGAPAAPLHPDFGDAGNPNAAKAASGRLGFYDRECPFQCVSDRGSNSASDANGMKANLNKAAPQDGTLDQERYGAVSGKNNTGRLNFFRDGDFKGKDIRLDVWAPANTNNVHYDGHAALTTTVTRWSGSTPGLVSGENGNGGQFMMKGTSATGSTQDVFRADGQAPLPQRDWDPSSSGANPSGYAYSGPTAALLPGLYREFAVAATFASDKNKPVTLQFRWEYAPQVDTVFADSRVGFNYATAKIFSEGKHSAPIQGKCWAQFTGTSSPEQPFAAQVNAATGTGSTNTLDGTLQEDAARGQSLFITFLRATSE